MTDHSTVTNLACFTQYISKNLDDQGQVDVIFKDFYTCLTMALLLPVIFLLAESQML